MLCLLFFFASQTIKWMEKPGMVVFFYYNLLKCDIKWCIIYLRLPWSVV